MRPTSGTVSFTCIDCASELFFENNVFKRGTVHSRELARILKRLGPDERDKCLYKMFLNTKNDPENFKRVQKAQQLLEEGM